MADLSDVSETLVSIAAQALYPNGTDHASVVLSPLKVYAGWPLPSQIETDLHAEPPLSHVTVWARDEERNTTRYGWEWQQPDALPAATVTATISGQTVTFAGTGAAGQNVAILANGLSFVYAVQAADTPTSIATALATQIAVSIPGTVSAGAVVTLPTSARIGAARVGVSATMTRELRRQERRWQISIWAPDNGTRNLVAQAVDVPLGALTFLSMPDGTAARIRYVGSHQVDAQQKEGIYRRDIFYTVEYATTQSTTATQVVTEQLNVSAQDVNQNLRGTVTVNL